MTVLEERVMNSAISFFTKQNHKEIDWEQRRYEIAKDVLSAIVSEPRNCQSENWPLEMSIVAVDVADALIENLKK